MNIMFDFNSMNDSKGNNMASFSDSLIGFALSDDGDYSQAMMSHRHGEHGSRKQPPTEPAVDVEAYTFQILSELDDDHEDLFDSIVLPPQLIDSGCYDPISVSDFLTPTTPKKRFDEKQQDIASPPLKKQRCISPSSETTSSEEQIESRFRGYQADQWTEKFEELCAFMNKNGHCQVPHGYPANESLARWTKRQRYQYKLSRLEGKPSTMTEDRIAALNDLGFVWNSHEAIWEERWTELNDFKQVNGHCNVPSQFETNQKLATWVKCQRRQYKLFVAQQQPSNMTTERAMRLHRLGFVWELRSHKKKDRK